MVTRNIRFKEMLRWTKGEEESFTPTRAEENILKNQYISKFIKLDCASDVLGITSLKNKNVAKEITESMAVIKRLKKITLKEPGKYTLYDLCAGNALTSLISVYSLPIKEAIAIDNACRDGNWARAKNFSYQQHDIHDLQPNFFKNDSILISVHPCKSLTTRVVELYNESSQASNLILIPCCDGTITPEYGFSIKLFGSYYAWSFQHAIMAKGIMTIDEKILSPRNAVIRAEKIKSDAEAFQ